MTSYLYDLSRARKDGAEPTGNGRRESFRPLPIPRMTNTYIAPGDAEPEELIAEIDRGFYAVSFGGGQVDPATGDFVFGVSEGYLIEGGKVTSPCGEATLIGNCLPALAAIDGVAYDFEIEDGVLRQGRPARPGRHRPGPRPDPRADGGRDGARMSDNGADLERLVQLAVGAALDAGASDAEAYAEDGDRT